VDGVRYRLEDENGYPRMYVAPAPGVNLEPYLNKRVQLQGTMIYHGELRANFITAARIDLVP
jgi:hypothetical protein